MNVDAGDRDDGEVGGKGFRVDLPGAAAVERVADAGAESGQVEMIDTVADLLVAREADADRPVRNLRMGLQKRGGLDDDGDARLVVGPEQRGAVGGHERLAGEVAKLRIVGDAEHLSRIAGED